MARKSKKKTVETLTHEGASRKNIPTAEFQSVMHQEEQSPVRVAYERRNRDLDPQLVWRGKDEQDWSDLVVHAPPLYIQEKVHPKVLIDDLRRRTEADQESQEAQFDLFANFNGLPDDGAKTEFYQHDANWTNRMILGDSLQVMASLAEREGLRGKVQCIYIDPPYGIKFNSNFQWSTTSRDVKDGKIDQITREPEQVKAFRDTWRDGIHSYLTYLRDRLTAARDLLADSGSIFVQISDENVHRVRATLDDVFGDECHVVTIPFMKKGNQKSSYIDPINDYILWYRKSLRQHNEAKFRRLFIPKTDVDPNAIWSDNLTSGGVRTNQSLPFTHHGKTFSPKVGNCWKTTVRNPDGSTPGMVRLARADRILVGKSTFTYKKTGNDFPYTALSNWWDGLGGVHDPRYVVETNVEVVKRCILMTTDPGDLVLDPTCGSGTTAYVAEQWGRRWITIDTSRVALAIARSRIMGARYPYYLLADSRDGQLKEAELTHSVPSEVSTHHDVRQGFVYDRVPHIMLSTIAHNAEIDVIWEKFQETLEPLRDKLKQELGEALEEWQMPREADDTWLAEARELHAQWWEQRIARQQEIDASIAAKADFEYLYDKPYEDKKKVRVAGPFTVESLAPHRVMGVDEVGELIDPHKSATGQAGDEDDFVQMILENLKTAGVCPSSDKLGQMSGQAKRS
ncbi:MAG: site-specific DNA-methyltransferase, partial [Candidatus Binatia bacterium]